MSQISPLQASMVQATQTQRQQSTDRARNLHHAQQLRRNSAAVNDEGDQAEAVVENPDQVEIIGDERQQADPRKSKQKKSAKIDSESSTDSGHIDMTA